MNDLTDRQTEILNYIRYYIEKSKISPSVRDIALRFGVSGPTIYQVLIVLQKKGYIKRIPKISRSIVVLEKEE